MRDDPTQGELFSLPEIEVEDGIAHHTGQILDYLGYSQWHNDDTGHLERTPHRFAKMLLELCTKDEFEFTTFPATADEMVTIGPISFYTLCSHHVVPFFGEAWVGYVPKSKVAGLSKIPRLVKNVAKGLHVQEELTGMIANALDHKLEPRGTAVVMRARHLCMEMRGIRQPGVVTTTSSMRGVFSDHTRTAKAEFLSWVQNG